MEEILKEINEFFGNEAQFVIKNNDLRITVGKKTIVIELPSIFGASSKA